MLNKEIEDIYDVTSIETVGIPNVVYRGKKEDDEKSYQHLRDVMSIGNIEFFTMTALIGKYIVGERKSMNNTTSFFRYDDNKNKDEMVILKALAVDEVDNAYILKDYMAMRTIWQEYSYAGFEELYKWYSEKTTNFEVRIAEEITNAFENNKKID